MGWSGPPQQRWTEIGIARWVGRQVSGFQGTTAVNSTGLRGLSGQIGGRVKQHAKPDEGAQGLFRSEVSASFLGGFDYILRNCD